jgi:hypothetical protein
MLMGFRVSQLLQADAQSETTPSLGGNWLAAGPDPITTQPGSFLQSRFANPAGLVNYSSVEPVVQDARPAQAGSMFQPVSYSFAH